MDDQHLIADQPAPSPDHSTASTPLALRPGPVWRLVLSLAWPVLLQQILALSVIFSDRLLAGRFQHVDAQEQIATQAALTTAGYISWLISSFTVLVSVGSTALIARFVGAGDRTAAVAATNQSILLAGVLGLAASIGGLLILPTAATLLRLEGQAATYAVAFLRPLLVVLPLMVVESAGIACLVGAGDTRTGLWVLAAVAGLNVPLAWLCFHGTGPMPGLGFAGIAVGTAVSQAVGGLIVLAVLARGRAGLRLRWSLLAPRPDLLRRLLRISLPAAVDSLSVAFGQLWFVSIINRLGDTASGAHGIALYWEALGYLSGGAFGVAAMTLVGQNLGAGRPEQAARSAWSALALGGSIMSLMGLVFFLLAPAMFTLFCPDPGQEPIVRTGVPVLRLIAFAMPPLASCIIFTGALRGAGDTRVPVLFSWFGYFGVRIPLALILTSNQLDLGPLGNWPGPRLGLLGAWWAMAADLSVRGVFFLWRFHGGRWQYVRV